MNKAIGIIFCSILIGSPLLLLFSPNIQAPDQPSKWQLQYRGMLEYAKRQPERLLYLTGLKQSKLDQVLEEASAKVSAIPEATVHSAGAALLILRHYFIEGLRSSLQGIEAAYLTSSHYLSKLAKDGWIPYQQSAWNYNTVRDTAKDWTTKGTELVRDGWEWIGPGGRLHPEEFLERFYGHIIIEGLLAVIIGYLFFQSSFKSSGKSPKSLSEEEIDELCIEWQPEPLHATLPKSKLAWKDIVITSSTGKMVDVQGVSGKVLNFVSFDFLGCAGNPDILDDCKATVAKYGVGACGPRGFYGTIDVHLNLEEALAKFMGTAECIIYAYDLSTVPSVLPAFANAKDLIVIDEAADYPIQNGCMLSRAKIARFKHNDMEDLEQVLKREIDLHRKQKKPLNRRFIIVEGIYKVSGDMAPLRKLYELKEKYKFRLIVDESMSFGVLGETGRGACEHFGLKPSDVEIVCASMGNALSSVGGFCVGDREIIDHQRLSGLGYCFSAALPPYLATAAIGSLSILDSGKGKELLEKIWTNARKMRFALSAIKELQLVGPVDSPSPVMHVQLPFVSGSDRDADAQLLQNIADRALKDSRVLFTVHKRSALDKVEMPPSIRVTVTAEHTSEDIDRAVSALKDAL